MDRTINQNLNVCLSNKSGNQIVRRQALPSSYGMDIDHSHLVS